MKFKMGQLCKVLNKYVYRGDNFAAKLTINPR